MLVYLCPSDRKYHCSWEGHAEDILDHFEKEHDDLIHYNETFIIDLEATSENRLFFLGEEIYLTQILTEKSQIVLKLRYLGPEKLAKKISFNINIKNADRLYQLDYIRTTPEGFFQVDVDGLKLTDPELKSLTCSLIINKEFRDDDSLESVFIEENGPMHFPEHTDTTNVGKEIQKSEKNEKVAEDNKTCDTGEADKTNGKTDKVDNDNRNEIELEIREVKSALSEDQEDNISISDFRMDSKDFQVTKNEYSEVSYLSRSKSTAFEDMRRSWFRTKSTTSLSSIQETDSPIICTNCSNFLKVPIYLCQNNHHFCEKCQPGTCNICHMKITSTRDQDLEETINKFSLSPCQFQKYGCPEKLMSNDLHLHETNCSFCLYKCPISECFFEAQFKGMCKHLKLIHSSTKLLSSFILSYHNYPEAFLANEEKGIFYCYVNYGVEYVEWSAKFCGPKERNFFCELKFKDGKMKEPVLLKKTENVYSVKKSLNDLKRLKVKPKNAVLTITF